MELYSGLALSILREAVMKSVIVNFYPVVKKNTDTDKHGRTEKPHIGEELRDVKKTEKTKVS